jgi:hypothetical protein
VAIGKHVTMQDAYWTIVLMEFAQVLLDLAHLLLFVLILAVPWKLVHFLTYVCEPKERWPLRLTTKALKHMQDAEWSLGRFRSNFVPYCNELLKDPDVAKRWHEGGKPLKMNSRDLSAHGATTRMVLSLVDKLPPEFGQPMQHCIELQDARLYHVALRAYAHCASSQGSLTMEEHATVLEELTKTEASLAEVQERATRNLENMIAEAWQSTQKRGCKKCGFWRKDIATLRAITRSVAFSPDLVGFLLMLLLIVTVYRLPSACAELLRERAWNPTKARFRLIMSWHLKALAEEVMLVLQIVILFVLLVASLIRFPEAVGSLGRSASLRDLRDNLLTNMKDALNSLGELLTLLTVWRTYSLIFRSIAQSLLVAPACITEMIGSISPCLPLGVRFVLGVLVVAGLFVSSFLGAVGRAAFLIGVVVIMVGSCAVTAKREGESQIRGWTSPSLRWTWTNFIALAAVFIEPTMLVLAMSTFPGAEYNRAENGTPLFGSGAQKSVCELSTPSFVVASVLIGIWSLLLSLMFVTGQEDEHGELQSNTLLRFMQLLLSHTLLVPICLLSLLPVACEDANFRGISLCLFAFYVCTTQALSTECGLLEPPPASGGLDLRYPTKYISISQAISVGLCIACTWSSPVDIIIAAVLGTVSLMYILVYPRVSAPICCVPYVAILRGAGALAVAVSAFFILYQRRSGSPLAFSVLLYTLCCLLCISVLMAMIRALIDHKIRQREFEQSGIIEECRKLLVDTEESLCDSQAVLGMDKHIWKQRWGKRILASSSPQSFALQLRAFEKDILVEWLTKDFVEDRKKWCFSLLEVRTWQVLQEKILVLRSGIRTPPTQHRLMLCLSRALGRHDISEKVVDCVVGHMELRAMLEPALFCAKTAKKVRKKCCICLKGGCVQMDHHFVWAHNALSEVLARFQATCLAPRSEPIVGVEKVEIGHSFLNVLTEPSHPQMYSKHLTNMLQTAGQLIDRHGEPHVLLPRGLVVGRALKRGVSVSAARTGTLRKKSTFGTGSRTSSRSNSSGDDYLFTSIPVETSLREIHLTSPIGRAVTSPTHQMEQL